MEEIVTRIAERSQTVWNPTEAFDLEIILD